MSSHRRSPKQQYLDWIDHRIEDFKAGLTREELLSLADEAVRDLFADANEQVPLTEILLRDAVDTLIARRLGLPTYRAWLRTCQIDTPDRPLDGTQTPGMSRRKTP